MEDSKYDDSKTGGSLEKVHSDSGQGTTEGSVQEINTSDKLPPAGSKERIAAEKRLVRRLDIRVLPTVFIIYVMNWVDVCVIFISSA